MKSKTKGKKAKRKGQISDGTGSANTVAPSVSGAYIQVAQKDELQRLSRLRKKLAELESELINNSESLLACNDPDSLDKFAKARGNKGDRFTLDLKQHAASLEKRKAKLLAQKKRVLDSIREISKPVPNGIFSSLATPLGQRMLPGKIGKPRVGPRANPQVQLRDFCIRKYAQLENSELCKRLDFELPHEGFALPKGWSKRFGVKTWQAAYEHPECKRLSLVYKLLWKAKSSS